MSSDRNRSWASQSTMPSKSAVRSRLTVPFGLSYGEWSVRWWRYLFSIPASINPVSNGTGADCGVDQSGPVFFLVGAIVSGSVVRNDCVVPAGKALFFPLINTEVDNEGQTTEQTIAQLRASAVSLTNTATGLHASVDGNAIEEIREFRVPAPALTFTFPATDNLEFVSCTGTNSPTCVNSSGLVVPFPGLTCTAEAPRTCTAFGVEDGFYVMLKPLSPGKHTINFGGTFPNVPFTLDITYNLTVRE